MRRNEFVVEDKAQILALLAQCEYGTLSLIDTEGLPYGVPVNFVWWEEGIAFHGANEGKKMHLLVQNPMASFNAVKSYALIPSYFSKTRSACPATQFFGSVTISGTVECIESLEAKASALNALMQKLQPQKGYETISQDNPIYETMLQKTSVLKLRPKILTCKIKAGQNLNSEQKEAIMFQLTQRAKEGDKETVTLMGSFHA